MSYCAVKDDVPVMPPSPKSIAILKKDLYIMDAWEVGINYPERVAINKTDKPVIPEGIDNPPVNQVLAMKE